MAPAGLCKRASAVAMARNCFHARIITGSVQKVNQKYYFYRLWQCLPAFRRTGSAIEKAHAGMGLVRNRRD
jgi:hypothetical protein